LELHKLAFPVFGKENPAAGVLCQPPGAITLTTFLPPSYVTGGAFDGGVGVPVVEEVDGVPEVSTLVSTFLNQPFTVLRFL
jgi:hypothetical protein